jgi:ribosome-associated protein
MDSIANEASERRNVFDIAGLLTEHQGEETIVLFVREECSFTDYFVITSAHSSRHLVSLAGYVRDYLSAHKLSMLNNAERFDESGWILIDCGSFIVHVMEQRERAFYELEKLWFLSPVVFHSSKSS